MANMNPRVRVLVIAAAALAVVGALVWFLSVRYWSEPVTPVPLPPPGELHQPQRISTPGPTPPASDAPTPESPPASPAPTPATTAPSPSWPPPEGWQPPATPTPAANLPAGALVIPVAGVRAEQLSDTFTQSRSEGRAHNALDIMAPRGTPVLAAADGRVVKLFYSKRGGITLYQLGPDERTIYYYAHLERYADGIHEGQVLRRGETLGYVGDTGNSGAGNYHLHFAIWLVTDPKRYWDGENVNPYPLLVKK